MGKPKKGSKPKDSKDTDVQELNRVISALKATEHNPIGWAAIFRVVAPILGRIAVRYTANYLASKWQRKATPKLRDEVSKVVAARLLLALKDLFK